MRRPDQLIRTLAILSLVAIAAPTQALAGGKAKVKASQTQSKAAAKKQAARGKVNGKTSSKAKAAKASNSATIGSGFFRAPAGGTTKPGKSTTGKSRVAAAKPAKTVKPAKAMTAKAKTIKPAKAKATKAKTASTTKAAPRAKANAKKAASQKVSSRAKATNKTKQRTTRQATARQKVAPTRQAQAQRQQIAGPSVGQSPVGPRPSRAARVRKIAVKVAKGVGLAVLIAAPSIVFPLAGLPIAAGLTGSGALAIGSIGGLIERAVRGGKGGPSDNAMTRFASRRMIQEHNLDGPGGIGPF